MSFAGKKVEQEVKVVQLKKLIEFFLVSEVKTLTPSALLKMFFLILSVLYVVTYPVLVIPWNPELTVTVNTTWTTLKTIQSVLSLCKLRKSKQYC